MNMLSVLMDAPLLCNLVGCFHASLHQKVALEILTKSKIRMLAFESSWAEIRRQKELVPFPCLGKRIESRGITLVDVHWITYDQFGVLYESKDPRAYKADT